MQDDVFIKKIKQGNQQALRVVVEKYKNHLYHIIYNVIRDEKEAEDLTQETFIKMVDALPSYEQKGFKTWLSRIAFHTAIDAKRKKEKQQEELPTYDVPVEISHSAEQEWLEREKLKNIVRSIEQMPDTYRRVVYAYYIEEKPYATISKEQKLAEKTVEMRLYRARKWMKDHWKEDEF